jgi:hypothetical protein
MRVPFATLMGLLSLLLPPPLAAQSVVAEGGAAPLVFVTVAGAPGDGDQALAAALSQQLEARGLKPADAFQANVYEVQGTVRLGPAGKNKESVTIVWVVLAPDGTQLGITRQKKDVRKGSLAKAWGPAAKAAAAAAAADIAKLIPRQSPEPL